MRKTIFAILIATAAMARAEIGRSAFNLGPYTATATNSNYATAIGYASGYMANGLTRSTLLGGASGRHGYSWMRCVGLGYGALDGASNCTDCVAIGDKAGARWRNANGWVQVGGAFAYTNGIVDIGRGLITGNANEGINVGPYFSTDSGGAYINGGNLYVNQTTSAYGQLSGGVIYGVMVDSADVKADTVRSHEIMLTESGTTTYPPQGCSLTWDGAHICVLTNGVTIGYLTITPAPPAQE